MPESVFHSDDAIDAYRELIRVVGDSANIRDHIVALRHLANFAEAYANGDVHKTIAFANSLDAMFPEKLF